MIKNDKLFHEYSVNWYEKFYNKNIFTHLYAQSAFRISYIHVGVIYFDTFLFELKFAFICLHLKYTLCIH